MIEPKRPIVDLGVIVKSSDYKDKPASAEERVQFLSYLLELKHRTHDREVRKLRQERDFWHDAYSHGRDHPLENLWKYLRGIWRGLRG